MERRVKLNVAVNEWKEAEDWGEFRGQIKQFVVLMLLSIVFVVVIGLGAYLRHNILSEHPLQQAAAFEVKQQALQGMLAEEMTYYRAHQQIDDITMKNFGIWLLEKVTNASLLDPATVVASELLYSTIKEQATLIHGGAGADPAVGPQDDHRADYEPNKNANSGLPVQEETTAEEPPSDSVAAPDPDDTAATEGTSTAEGEPSTDYKAGSAAETTDNKDKPIAFIYHTHNRESWNAEMKDSDRDAQSSNKNITLVGQRLAEELEKLGLGSMVSDTDYPTTVPGYEWEYSYKYSRKTVKEALASNNELEYIFDLHRDSQARKYTTAEINGESYAQVYFIIGQRNPNWKENEAFARKLHDKLEAQYPGLSRGIWGKNANSGNAEYNQSLSSQSVLIEVGGIDNTLEECYRTAKALAEVIAQLHQES